MVHTRFLRPLAAAGLVAALLAGCGPKYAVEVLYPHPTRIELGAHTHTLAVYPFAAADGTDQAWAEAAADQLSDALDPDDPRYPWREVIDLGTSGEPSDAAFALAAGAQAVITGTVTAECSEVLLGTTEGQAVEPQRTCDVRVAFRVTDTATGATLATRTIQRRYDSSAPAAEPMDADEATAQLIGRCVADFATMLASYEMRVTIPLRRGETYTTDIANRLAVDGAYSQALALYERSLTLYPNDDGAQFNAGVMHEVMGQLDAALRRYDRAFGMEARSEYGLARDRVRLRMQREY